MEDVPVVILAGGQGTRIREESEFRPKPMVNIGERPILWHIMKNFQMQGFRRFFICLGYKGYMIKSYFLHYRMMHSDFTIGLDDEREIKVHSRVDESDWEVTLCETGLNTMTGARVKKIEKYLKGQTFMLTYGDGVANVDCKALLKFHKSHGKIATVTGVNPPSRFGELMVENNRVKKFAEKPERGHMINGGFFVFNGGLFDYLPKDDSLTLEKEPLEQLAKKGELMAYQHEGFWQCMDTVRDMNYLNEMWAGGKAPWKIW